MKLFPRLLLAAALTVLASSAQAHVYDGYPDGWEKHPNKMIVKTVIWDCETNETAITAKFDDGGLVVDLKSDKCDAAAIKVGIHVLTYSRLGSGGIANTCFAVLKDTTTEAANAKSVPVAEKCTNDHTNQAIGVASSFDKFYHKGVLTIGDATMNFRGVKALANVNAGDKLYFKTAVVDLTVIRPLAKTEDHADDSIGRVLTYDSSDRKGTLKVGNVMLHFHALPDVPKLERGTEVYFRLMAMQHLREK